MPDFDLDRLSVIPYSPSLAQRLSNSEFDCENNDLNEFLKKDARIHYSERLAQTFVILDGDRIAGFFSLLADSLRLGEEETADFRERGISYPSFPAVKIGRFGIDQGYKRKGVGKLAFRGIVGLVNNLREEIGCRFLTVIQKKNLQRSASGKTLDSKRI